ncbi:hypothetical protein K488DRAFT_75221 [Vararia minispora EC-137]|uniref:Uncharacterized protein n=1 Tax=Vararia minispora EC-137 TaxID=1314806 RepID=A0ACB8Q4A7_9AGAM|nr:hypothetical protein K488DRAFT_75221 [Vararia minispora EC-137]
MSFLWTLQKIANNLTGMNGTDDGSGWDVEMGNVDQSAQEGEPQGNVPGDYWPSDGMAGNNEQAVDGEGGSAPQDEIGEVAGTLADAGAQASATPAAASDPSPPAGPSTTSGGGAGNAGNLAEGTDNRVRLSLSLGGCGRLGVSLPLTRDGKYVLLGLAVVAILIGTIALVITVVQNRRSGQT